MKPNQDSEKISISLPRPMAKWLREQAKEKASSISQIVRDHVLPAMKSNTHQIVQIQDIGAQYIKPTMGRIKPVHIAAEDRQNASKAYGRNTR